MPVAGACIYEYTLHTVFILQEIHTTKKYLPFGQNWNTGTGVTHGDTDHTTDTVRYRLKDTGGRAGTTDEVVVLVCDFWMISNTEQTRTTDEPHNHPSQPTNAHARPRDDRIRGQLSHNPGARTEPRGRLRRGGPLTPANPTARPDPAAARAPWRYRI